LEIEARHGFRSTFFWLHDCRWKWHGVRYSFRDPAVREIARMARDAGCEMGVHGGYYRFNDAGAYRESREAVSESFGVEATGIRNHYLRFSYPETWRAMDEAGFAYDATFGYRALPGARSGLAWPFFAFDAEAGKRLDLLELPLTIMEVSVFNSLGLGGDEALDYCERLAGRLAGCGALVSLLWHNDYFADPEFADRQRVYEELLARLAERRPWCATGAEINEWWRARAGVALDAPEDAGGGRWRVKWSAGSDIDGLTLRIRGADRWGKVEVRGGQGEVRRDGDDWLANFPKAREGSVEIHD